MNTPLDNFQSFLTCPLCPKKDGVPEQITFLEESNKKAVFHVSCSQCHTASIVSVTSGQFGMMSVGVLTDLKQEEAKQVFGSETVSPNHVLEVHQLLRDEAVGVETLIGK